LEKRYGVTSFRKIPGLEERRKETIRTKYGADNVFSKESSLYEEIEEKRAPKRGSFGTGDANPMRQEAAKNRQTSSLRSHYGVEHPLQSPKIQQHLRETCQTRYGVDFPGAIPDAIEKRVATNMIRFGGPAPACSPEVIGKMQATYLERYGVSNPQQNKDVRAKTIATLVEKYGVDHPSKIEGFWDKAVATFIRRYGVTHTFLLAEFLDKRRKTCRERYGVDEPLQSPSIYARSVATWMNNYGVDNPSKVPEILAKMRAGYVATCTERYGVPNAMMDKSIALKALRAAGGRGGANSLEQQFASLNPELLYTGNGKVWRRLPKLGHYKNPDFIVPGPDPEHPRRGISKVVEVFGDYWHSPAFTGKETQEHEHELIDAFGDIGIACLVVWESEFKADPAQVRAKVQTFLAPA
jgi:hypothetical protein